MRRVGIVRSFGRAGASAAVVSARSATIITATVSLTPGGGYPVNDTATDVTKVDPA